MKVTGGIVKEQPGPLGLGTGLATLAITYPFAAVAVGILETEEPVHWLLRVGLGLFCLPFIGIGILLVVGGAAAIVNTGASGKAPFPLRAVRYIARQITRPRHILAALPIGIIVAQYWGVARTGSGFFGIDAELLRQGIVLEFFAIHATGFIGVCTLIPARGRLLIARYAAFALFGAMYLGMASTYGWAAAILLLYFVGVKLGPFLLAPPDLHSGANVGLRWGFQMVVFLGVITAFGGMESFLAGAIYWSAILAAEWLGMMQAQLFQREEAPAPDRLPATGPDVMAD